MASPDDPFLALVSALKRRRVRFVLIGVSGANQYARHGGSMFATQDHDLFLPPDPANMLRAWRACESLGLRLIADDEPLDHPRDIDLARTVCRRRALVAAQGPGLQVDLTQLMAGFTFARVAKRARTFVVAGVRLPVARLSDIVASKATLGRPKDRLFLAAHEEGLRDLIVRSARRSPRRKRN